MKELPVIEATYLKLAEVLDREVEAAEEKQDENAADRVRKRQQVNDSAYLLLIWAQFEAKVNEAASAAIRRHVDDPDWRVRRAWDAYNPASMRFRFEDRLALVLDRKNLQGEGFRRAIRLYDARNQIAHGRSLGTAIDVSAIIQEIFQIVSEMRE